MCLLLNNYSTYLAITKFDYPMGGGGGGGEVVSVLGEVELFGGGGRSFPCACPP